MSSVSVDLSGIKALKDALKNADKERLQVGWFESAKYDDGTPVASVAAMQEFGTKTAPPRPFFRPAISENETAWSELVEDGSKEVIEGNVSMNAVFNGLGLTVEADIRNKITGDHLALSPVTLALRKLKHDGRKIGGALVGAVAGAVARGETGPGQLGEASGNTTPLKDTGMMLATLTYEVGQ